MRGPHVRFCESGDGAILRAYSTVTSTTTGDFGRPGLRWFFLAREEPSLARPSRDRSPDEALHAISPDKHAARRGRQGVLQCRDRTSDREGSPTTFGEEDVPRTPSGRPATFSQYTARTVSATPTRGESNNDLSE